LYPEPTRDVDNLFGQVLAGMTCNDQYSGCISLLAANEVFQFVWEARAEAFVTVSKHFSAQVRTPCSLNSSSTNASWIHHDGFCGRGGDQQ